MGEAVIAVIATIVGAVVALAGEVVRERITSGRRWHNDLYRAATEVMGSYGVMRNVLVEARQEGVTAVEREALEFGRRAHLLARLMALPGSEDLMDDLDDLAGESWRLLRATREKASEEDWQKASAAQRASIRRFEAQVRSLLS
jgi:hypothetical protein